MAAAEDLLGCGLKHFEHRELSKAPSAAAAEDLLGCGLKRQVLAVGREHDQQRPRTSSAVG